MKFSELLRKTGHSIWEANFNHPFVQGIGGGTLAGDKFIFFLEQDYVFLMEYCRFFGLVIAKANRLDDMRKFSEILQATVSVEMELHRRVCFDFGISSSKLEETKPA